MKGDCNSSIRRRFPFIFHQPPVPRCLHFIHAITESTKVHTSRIIINLPIGSQHFLPLLLSRTMTPRAGGRSGRGRKGRRNGPASGTTGRGGRAEKVGALVSESDTNETISSLDSPQIPGDSNDKSSVAGGEPELLTIHGEKYYKAEDIANKKSKKKTSHIWKRGFEIAHAGSGTRHYYCCMCLDERKNLQYKPIRLNGTSSIHWHFQSVHKIDKSGDTTVKETAQSAPANTLAMRSSTPNANFVFQFAFEKFKLLLIKWIVCCHIAFYQLENGYFREILNFLNDSFGGFLPSRITIRQWVLAEFHVQKEKLKKELRSSKSNIHISFDLWTSPNNYSIIAVVAHFIDAKCCRQNKLLAIRQVQGRHSGENIASTLRRVIKEYRIKSRLGFFIGDNASSNDVAIDHVLRRISPDMSREARGRRRIRCLAHVTNLIAKAFLLGQKAENFASSLHQAEAAEREGDSSEIASVWRKHGPLGRLQNLIRHIRVTPQRRQEFKSCQSDAATWKEYNKFEVWNIRLSLFSFLVHLQLFLTF